jgi:hypothetical protein
MRARFMLNSIGATKKEHDGLSFRRRHIFPNGRLSTTGSDALLQHESQIKAVFQGILKPYAER